MRAWVAVGLTLVVGCSGGTGGTTGGPGGEQDAGMVAHGDAGGGSGDGGSTSADAGTPDAGAQEQCADQVLVRYFGLPRVKTCFAPCSATETRFDGPAAPQPAFSYDAQGRLTGFVVARADGTDGRRLTLEWHPGYVLETDEYVSQSGPKGDVWTTRTATYSLDAAGRIADVTGESGARSAFSYDGDKMTLVESFNAQGAITGRLSRFFTGETLTREDEDTRADGTINYRVTYTSTDGHITQQVFTDLATNRTEETFYVWDGARVTRIEYAWQTGPIYPGQYINAQGYRVGSYKDLVYDGCR